MDPGNKCEKPARTVAGACIQQSKRPPFALGEHSRFPPVAICDRFCASVRATVPGQKGSVLDALWHMPPGMIRLPLQSQPRKVVLSKRFSPAAGAREWATTSG